MFGGSKFGASPFGGGDPAVTVHQITGSIVASATVAADVSLIANIVGSASGAGTTSSVVTIVANVTGSVLGVGSTAGSLIITSIITGSVFATASLTGDFAFESSNLIVEDGSNVPNANSYISLSYATSYHIIRNNTGWAGTVSQREAAIIMAVDNFELNYGNRLRGESSGSSLSFPRLGGTAFYNNGTQIEGVPESVRRGIAESALSILTSLIITTTRDSNTLSFSRSVGSISETKTYNNSGAILYAAPARFVHGLLRELGSSRA